ncbi:MAG: winged helix-turn-helix domain-containing protein [Deinococcales bacterium]
MAENLWVLDSRGTILEAPVREPALAEVELVGRSCAEVVRGTDERGRDVCERCPVRVELRRGAFTAETTLWRGGRRQRCTATLGPEGTEVRLSDALRPGHEEVLISLARAVDRMRDRSRLFPTLRGFLDVLRRAAGVEASELFLIDPGHSSMLLTVHQGRDAAAFQERAAFRLGEGYPGIVAYEGTPLVTQDLANDDRYLRGKVKRLGYRTFLSYPLNAPGGFVGVVDLASRSADVPVRSLSALMSMVGPVLAAALYGVLSELSEEALAEVGSVLRRGQPDAAHGRVARLAEELCGARTVALMTAASGQADGGSVRCPHLGECPLVRNGPEEVGVAGVGIAGVGCPMGSEGPARYCLPWRLGDEVVGVQSVVLARPPSPGTQYMAPLLWLQHRAAQLLGAASADGAAGDGMPRVTIRTFGTFQLTLDGRPFDPRSLGRRKAWVLLKLLVAQRGHVLAREELAERLWPGDDPVAAVKRVHVLVSTLRKAIEMDPQAPALILSEGEGYTFSPLEPVDLDVVTFEQLIDEADRSEGMLAIRSYAEALRRYRGPFMAEEAYNDAFELDRSYFRERATRALERCAALQEAQGRTGDAIVSLRRLLQADPWHRPGYDALARLLEQRGDTEQAALVRVQGERVLQSEV